MKRILSILLIGAATLGLAAQDNNSKEIIKKG